MKYLFSILLVLGFLTASSQSAFTVKESRKAEAQVEQVSLANPWVGAKLSMAINDPDNDIANNFIFSARVLYEAVTGDNYSVPIVGSFALGNDDMLSPESGFNAGVYPYYIAKESEGLAVVMHGGAGYKIIPQGSDFNESPQQIRALAGVELAFKQDGKLPTTLSVTPTYLMHFNSDLEDSFGIEVTGVLPISDGLGVLAEYQRPFTDGAEGVFRLGIMVNSPL